MTRGGRGRGARGALPVALGAALLLVVTGCQSLARASCAGTLVPEVTGTIADPDIQEASGISGGWRNPDVWWVHNDSGDSARVFAVGTDGADRGTFALSGASASDWEDLAIGPGPVQGVPYLYVADIGDNGAARTNVRVYRFPEPTVTGSNGTVTDPDVLTFTYPGGARDAEALLVDPTTGDLFIVSKSYSGNATVYRAPAGLADGSTTVLQAGATLVLGSGQAVTGGEVSVGGDTILLRTYQGVWSWSRTTAQSVDAAMAAAPCAGQSVSETQGEAIGFAGDSSGYVTVSEGSGQPLHWFGVPEP
jgi:hypothetical protein